MTTMDDVLMDEAMSDIHNVLESDFDTEEEREIAKLSQDSGSEFVNDIF